MSNLIKYLTSLLVISLVIFDLTFATSLYVDENSSSLAQSNSEMVTWTWTGQQNHVWHVAGNWSPLGVPADSDDVVIPAAVNIPEISQDASCHNLLIKEGGSVIIRAYRILVVNGDLSIGDSLTQTDGKLSLEEAAVLHIGGNYYKRNTSNFESNSSTIIFEGFGDQNVSQGGTGSNSAFHNITIDKSIGNVILSSDLDINGSLDITNGTFNTVNYNLFVAQNWINTGAWIQTGGTVTFDATSGGPYTIDNKRNGTFNHIVFNANGLTHRLASDIDINRNLTINAGSLQAQGFDIYLGGTWTNNGFFTPAGGSIIFNGTINQDVNSGGTGFGKSFNHFTIQKPSGTLKINAPLNATGNLIINSGTFNMNNRDVNVGGSFTNAGVIQNATKLDLNAISGGPYSFSSGASSLNIVNLNAPGITYNLVGNSTILGNLSVSAGNLIFNGYHLIFGDASTDMISVSGLLDIDAGAELSMNDGTSLTTNSGGELKIVGVAGKPAVITTHSKTGYYKFTVASGGKIQACNAFFEFMGSDGIEIQSGASIDTSNNFSNVKFDHGQPGGSMLNVGDITGNNQRLDIENTSFLSNPGGGAFNVTHTTGDDTLNFIDAQGPFAGEAFANAGPNDALIHWMNFSPTRVWNGSSDNNWYNPNNWTEKIVPNAKENAILPASGVKYEPFISKIARLRNLTIETPRILTVSDGSTLDLGGYLDNDGTVTLSGSAKFHIAGDFNNPNGTFNDNASTVIFDSTLTQTLNTGGMGNVRRFYNFEINKSTGSVILQSEFEVNNDVNLKSGTLDANGYDMKVANNWISQGTFLHNGNTVIFDAQSSGPYRLSSDGSPFNNLIFAGGKNSYSYRLGSTMAINGNLTILQGELVANGNRIDFDGDNDEQISINGILYLDDSSILQMSDETGIDVNPGGTLKVIGSSAATRPTITYFNSGYYDIEVESGGALEIAKALIEYTGGSGIHVKAGANLNTAVKFDSVEFRNGGGDAYLTIENSQKLVMSHVRFDSSATSRPLYNIQYAGSGALEFSDYQGTMSGVNYENDNGAGIRGNVRWYFTQTEAVSSPVTFGNDLVISPSGNLGNVTGVLVDQALSLAVDSSVARYYTVQPSNSGAASIRLYYGDNELQLEVEQDLLIWRRRNGQWTLLGGNVYTSMNYIEIPGNNYDLVAGVKDTLIISDATDDTSLPVELVLFEAMITGKNIVLQWKTASELENAGWLIDRKIISREEYEMIENGELELQNTAHDFLRLASLEGQGSVSSLTEYEYVDENISFEYVYAYRLIDISFNGEMTWHSPLMVVPPAVPGKFELVQNYPNPFNPETTIKFNLPVNARISLRIYNILGQRIKTLQEGEMPAGFYEIRWDGTNQNRQTVASGTYIYQISAKSTEGQQTFTQSKRMILMR